MLDATTTAGRSATTEQPTTTTTQTTTPTGSASGSRDNPIPAGTPARVGDIEVTVLSWEQDGTDAVLAENMFNDEPKDGWVYSLIWVKVEYVGTDSAEPWLALDFRGLGASGVTLTDECGVVPDDVWEVPELFPGGSREANACLTVPVSDLDSLMLFVEESFAYSANRVFFDLP